MKEFSDGCIIVTARNAASAAKKIAKVKARLAKQQAQENRQAAKAMATKQFDTALKRLCAGQ